MTKEGNRNKTEAEWTWQHYLIARRTLATATDGPNPGRHGRHHGWADVVVVSLENIDMHGQLPPRDPLTAASGFKATGDSPVPLAIAFMTLHIGSSGPDLDDLDGDPWPTHSTNLQIH